MRGSQGSEPGSTRSGHERFRGCETTVRDNANWLSECYIVPPSRRRRLSGPCKTGSRRTRITSDRREVPTSVGIFFSTGFRSVSRTWLRDSEGGSRVKRFSSHR